MADGTILSKGARWLLHAADRTHEAVVDRDYRQYLMTRTMMRSLSRINPNLRYVGLLEGDKSTFLHLNDSVITPWAIAVGHFQRTDFERAWTECNRLVPRKPNGVFVDVGANVGTTTLYAMRSGDFGRAVCMEPSPNNLDVLRLNVLTNGLTESVSIIPAACSAESGSADLWITSGNQGDHRIARNTGHAPKTHESVLKVDTLTLDEALRSVDVSPSDVAMVWVDTQGHEPEVLAGARAVIGDGVPFCIEFWPSQYAASGTLPGILDLVEDRFSHFIELREGELRSQPVPELRALSDRLLHDADQIDIILIP
jgi:FkbM family methyltransferase